MTQPLRLPLPARIPHDMEGMASLDPSRGRRRLNLPTVRASTYDDAEEATLLWRPTRDHSGVRSSHLAPSAAHFWPEEHEATVISKPNLDDPRLLRSDLPPAPREAQTPAPSVTHEGEALLDPAFGFEIEVDLQELGWRAKGHVRAKHVALSLLFGATVIGGAATWLLIQHRF